MDPSRVDAFAARDSRPGNELSQAQSASEDFLLLQQVGPAGQRCPVKKRLMMQAKQSTNHHEHRKCLKDDSMPHGNFEVSGRSYWVPAFDLREELACQPPYAS